MSSMVSVSPNRSSRTVNVSSKTSVMSFSLQKASSIEYPDSTNSYAQTPSKAAIKLVVDALQICERDRLADHALVDTTDEVDVEEPSMVNAHPNHTSDKHEVIQVLGIDA